MKLNSLSVKSVSLKFCLISHFDWIIIAHWKNSVVQRWQKRCGKSAAASAERFQCETCDCTNEWESWLFVDL